jgi:hypothetical protein
MSEKLGEMLLQAGALTEEQLAQVLSAQSVYGGRLGTNLIEMGLLSESDLAELLNRKLGVPAVDLDSLEGLAPSLIAVLPQEMVLRFQVLPIALDGKRLTLAMADPSDFNAIDEIGFYTGLVIVPRVCSELRLAMALERYYGIKRALNFIPVSGGTRTRMTCVTRMHAGLEPHPESTVMESDRQPCLEQTSHNADAEPDSPPGGNPQTSSGPDKAPPRLDLATVAGRFADATNEAAVVTTLMSYLKGEFDRTGFLSVRRDTVVGVQAVAKGAVVDGFSGWTIGLEGAALVRRALKEKTPYLGMFPDGGTEAQILAKIGGPPGATALLLPLVIGGIAVAFLLIEDENSRMASGLFDLQRVVAKAGLAFEMVGLRKKIGQV